MNTTPIQASCRWCTKPATGRDGRCESCMAIERASMRRHTGRSSRTPREVRDGNQG